MGNITKLITILIFSFIGADRINLLSDNFNFFIFTPFIFLSIIFILFVLLFHLYDLKFSWLFNNKLSFHFLCIYLLTIIISTIFSMDIYLSLKRIVLIFFILFVIILILSLYDISTINNILFKSSILGSLLFLIFNILLSLNWFSAYDFTTIYINLIPDEIAYFVPRLGGYSSDVNRGTAVLLFFTLILYNFSHLNRYIKYLVFLNIFFILVSFSRTIYLMMFIIFIWKFLKSNRSDKIVMGKYVLISFLTLSCLLIFLEFRSLIDIKLLIDERINIFDFSRFTSSGIHLKLIIEGFFTAFSSIKILLFGSGFGTSYHLIEGYYWSGTKYGNYHSMYITSLVECGIFNSIFLFIYSFLYPLYISNKNIFLDLVIGLFFFNFFYQLNVEPMFWAVILLFYKTNYEINNG